jgi:hypothetical protein
MKEGKPPRRPSKADVSEDRVQKRSDVDTRAAAGGDKRGNKPLQRPMKGGGPTGPSGSRPKR